MNPFYTLRNLALWVCRVRVLWMPLMCALWITGASAQEIEDRMGAALSAFAGQPIGIESVRPSPAPGIVEVQVINGPLLYATEDGGYFFLNGDLHQSARKQVAPLVAHPLRNGTGLAIQQIARETFEKHLDRPVRVSRLARAMTIEVILLSVLGTMDQRQVARFSAAFNKLLSKASFLLHFSPVLQ